MKKLLLALLVCSTLLAASGCSSIDVNDIYHSDREIVKSEDRHSASLSVYDQTFVGELGQMYAASYVGIETLWSHDAVQNDVVTVQYELLSRDGKAKLVLIAPDGEITLLAENTENTLEDPSSTTEPEALQTQTFSLKKGRNRIRVVACDDPALRLRLRVDVGITE